MTSPLIREHRGEANDLFTPVQFFHKLPVWLDAYESGTMSINALDQVASIRNKGYAGGDFTQATDANKPVYTSNAINGRPAFKGYNAATASSLSLVDSPELDYTTCSIYAVVRRHTDVGAGVETIGGKWNTTGNQREHRIRTSAAEDLVFDMTTDGTATISGISTPTNDMALDTNYIVDAIKNTTFTAASINGSNIAGGNLDVDANVVLPFNGTAPYTLFSRNTLGDAFGGYIGEYLFFNQALLTTERSRVLAYLSRKWGIQLLA